MIAAVSRPAEKPEAPGLAHGERVTDIRCDKA